MKVTNFLILMITVSGLVLTSCVSKKKYASLQSDMELAQADLSDCEKERSEYVAETRSALRPHLNTVKSR
jgi:outer membrane murein-binding lipoprotein Lpp